MLNLTTGEPYDWNPDVDQMVTDFDIVDGKIYFVGSFTTVGGQARNYIAASYLHNASLLNWNPSINSGIGSIAHNNGKIFIGGGFTSVNGQTRKYLTSLDSATGQPTSFNPFSSSASYVSISTIKSNGNDVFIGGNFTTFDGASLSRVASINGQTQALNSFDAKLSGAGTPSLIRVSSIVPTGNALYLGGTFTKSDTITSPGFLRVTGDSSSYIVDQWIPNSNNSISPIGQNNDDVYLAFSQSKINNKCRCYTSAIDTTTKQLTSWYPSINSGPITSAFAENNIYMGGYFSSFNYEINNYLIGSKLNSVGIEDITNNSFCLGGVMNIKITSTGIFDSTNKFVLLLSDTMGTFNSPTYLDTIYTASDSFLFQIPTTFIPHNNYRLKVISTQTKLENSEDFYINILPEPKADFTINDSFQCLHNNVFIFTNTSNIPGKVVWDFGDSNTGNTAITSHSYTTDSLYSIRMILKPFGNGCPFDTINYNVEVLPQPHPYFTVNDSVQCNHIDSFAFINNSTIRYGSMSYFWDFGNTTTSTDTNTHTNFTDTGWHKIVLTTTSDSGCVDSINKKVLVIEKLQPTFTVNSPSQCLVNNYFEFTNNTTLTPYFNIRWNLGENDTASAPVAVKSFTKDSVYSITLFVIKDSACFDTTSVNIYVNPQPKALFTIDSTIKCATDTFFFSNSTTIKTGFISNYTWNFGDGVSANDTNVHHTYDSAGQFNVQLIAVSDSGCLDTFSTVVQTKSLPIARFEINDTAQCFYSQNFLFNNLSTAPQNDSIISYNWSFGDSTFAFQKNTSHTYSDTGYYFVLLKVLSAFGCSDTAQLIAIVAPAPAIDTIFGPTQVVATDTNRYTIVNDTFTTYYWSVDYGTLILGSDSSYTDIIWDSITTQTNATIKILAVNDAGCTSDTAYLSIKIDSVALSYMANFKDNRLIIFPNPASKFLHILLTDNTENDGEIEIFDALGNNVYKQPYMNLTNNDLEIDISKFKAGLYFATIKTKSYTSSAKFIITNQQ
jgi:PKD repeat protein